MFEEPILHVDMDAFFVEVERLRRPELVGAAVAVGGGGPRGVVASASYEARAGGVHSAMPAAEARRRCPSLILVPTDHGEYERISGQVFEILRSFTPLVEGLSIDEAFLDVGGLRHHYSSPEHVGREIRRSIRQRLSLPASVGVAATKFVAKLASQRAKPDGLLVVSRREQPGFLDGLPVAALWGVGEATQAALSRLGVGTIAELRGTPVRVLERAVGSAVGQHLHRLAAGDDARPVVPDADTKSVSAEETFPTDLSGRDELAGALLDLVGRVTTRMRRGGLVGRTVVVKIRHPDFTTCTRSETLRHPTDVEMEVREAARRLFEKRPNPELPLRLLGVSVTGLTSAEAPRQLALDADPRWEQVDDAVDAVRSRFGWGSVGPARLAGSTVRKVSDRPDR